MEPIAINILCDSNAQCGALLRLIMRKTGRKVRGAKLQPHHNVVCVGSRLLYTLPLDKADPNVETFPRITYNKNSDAILKILDKLGGE